jgi:hypothetical protein
VQSGKQERGKDRGIRSILAFLVYRILLSYTILRLHSLRSSVLNPTLAQVHRLDPIQTRIPLGLSTSFLRLNFQEDSLRDSVFSGSSIDGSLLTILATALRSVCRTSKDGIGVVIVQEIGTTNQGYGKPNFGCSPYRVWW